MKLIFIRNPFELKAVIKRGLIEGNYSVQRWEQFEFVQT